MIPEISVIVPVYNIEEYLWTCLSSLRNQSFSDIEILLVDDGSTDRSGEICEQAAIADSRFRVIHQKNLGLSKARETGVRHAGGNWIMFVDGDDWVAEDFCGKALSAVKAFNVDICVFEFYEIRETTRMFNYHQIMPCQGMIDRKEALSMLADGRILDYLWNKIYRRSLLESMTFPPDRLLEDMRTMCRIFAGASRIYLMSERLYYYRRRNGSLTLRLSRSRATKETLLARYEKFHYIKAVCPEAAASMVQVILSSEMNYYAANYFVPREKRNLKKIRRRILGRQRMPADTTQKRKLALRIFRKSGLLFALLWQARQKVRTWKISSDYEDRFLENGDGPSERAAKR